MEIVADPSPHPAPKHTAGVKPPPARGSFTPLCELVYRTRARQGVVGLCTKIMTAGATPSPAAIHSRPSREAAPDTSPDAAQGGQLRRPPRWDTPAPPMSIPGFLISAGNQTRHFGVFGDARKLSLTAGVSCISLPLAPRHASHECYRTLPFASLTSTVIKVFRCAFTASPRPLT